MEQPNFGGELRRLRQQRGLSLKKFAQLVHYEAYAKTPVIPRWGLVRDRCLESWRHAA